MCVRLRIDRGHGWSIERAGGRQNSRMRWRSSGARASMFLIVAYLGEIAATRSSDEGNKVDFVFCLESYEGCATLSGRYLRLSYASLIRKSRGWPTLQDLQLTKLTAVGKNKCHKSIATRRAETNLDENIFWLSYGSREKFLCTEQECKAMKSCFGGCAQRIH